MKRLGILLLVVVAGCATTEKKAKNYYLNNKDQLAELCQDCFPVKTEVKPGKEIELKRDSVFIKGSTDTVFVTVDCPDGTTVKKPCPPTTDTLKVYIPVLRVDTLIRADSAAIYHWQSEYRKSDLARSKAELHAEGESKSKWIWIWVAVVGWGILLVKFLLWLWRLYRAAGLRI